MVTEEPHSPVLGAGAPIPSTSRLLESPTAPSHLLPTPWSAPLLPSDEPDSDQGDVISLASHCGPLSQYWGPAQLHPPANPRSWDKPTWDPHPRMAFLPSGRTGILRQCTAPILYEHPVSLTESWPDSLLKLHCLGRERKPLRDWRKGLKLPPQTCPCIHLTLNHIMTTGKRFSMC